MWAIKHRIWSSDEVISLSEQQLVDCDLVPNLGCKGGEARYAYKYVRINGLATSDQIPYKNKLRVCTYEPEEMRVASISDFKIFQRVLN